MVALQHFGKIPCHLLSWRESGELLPLLLLLLAEVAAAIVERACNVVDPEKLDDAVCCEYQSRANVCTTTLYLLGYVELVPVEI